MRSVISFKKTGYSALFTVYTARGGYMFFHYANCRNRAVQKATFSFFSENCSRADTRTASSTKRKSSVSPSCAPPWAAVTAACCALTDDEKADIPAPFVNIPLEAGFDMEPASNGQTLAMLLRALRWTSGTPQLNWDYVEESRRKGKSAFAPIRKNI